MPLKENAHLYFMGIGGTGMAAAAGLLQSAGYKITGSDKGIYPPMSHMLSELKIPVSTPYKAENIASQNPDLVVIANALSRGNEEIEYVLDHKLPYTSFPQLLGEAVLEGRQAIVVSGTHGKTTTTSLVAYILRQLGEDPSFLIGGIPKDFPRSFHLGKSPLFAIEGDEYDTAFFDKGPKFFHYRPKYLILNNLEFDHADIFQSLEDIEKLFHRLIELVPKKENIIANIDDPGVHKLLSENAHGDLVTKVSTTGAHKEKSDLWLESFTAGEVFWNMAVHSKSFGTFSLETKMSGEHNIANLCQVIALIERLQTNGAIKGTDGEAIARAAAGFSGVQRRLEKIGETNNIQVYEDFAHHPTAISKVIAGFRKSFPGRKLWVAFEPANATGRRNVLMDDFSQSLSLADEVLIGPSPSDTRIPVDERMDVMLMAQKIGSHARSFNSNEELLDFAAKSLQPGASIIFMSPSSFSGIQQKIMQKL